MKKALLALALAAMAATATAQATYSRPLGKWAIVMVESGKQTDVIAAVCFNRYAPPVQIGQGLWRLSNPHEQTIKFVCEALPA